MATRSLNKVMLIGNLTRDPEIKYTSAGAALCSFGLATNRSWKDTDGETREEAEFHNLVAWNKMAEVCYQILAKGMKVYIEGELRTRNWEAEDGSNRYRTEIKVNEMVLLNSQGKTGAGGGFVSDDAGAATSDDDAGNSSSDEKKTKKAPKKSTKPSKEAAPAEEGGEDILDDDLPF